MKRLSPYKAADIATTVYDVINTSNLANVFKSTLKRILIFRPERD